MGLDLVELVMACEERYGIIVPDEDAGQFSTVGDLHEFILGALQKTSPPDQCLTSAAFYKFRRAAMEALGLPRRTIRPDSSVSDLVPWRERRRFWIYLREIVGLPVPRLERPSVLVLLSFSLYALIVFGLFATKAGTTLLVTSALVIPLVIVVITEPFARDLPSGVFTVRDLIKSSVPPDELIAAGNPDSAKSWDRERLWDDLKQLVVSQLGVKPEQVVPTARFYHDLLCD